MFLNPLALDQDYLDTFKSMTQDYMPLGRQDLVYLNGMMDCITCGIHTAPAIHPVTDNLSACAADNSTTNTLYQGCVGSMNTNLYGWAVGYHPEYMATTKPSYLQTQLNYFWNTLRKPIVITEFGLAMAPWNITTDFNDARYDVERSEYYLSCLTSVLQAISEDGVDVMGAFMWSWVNNWEWGIFDHQFGLQFMNETTQERIFNRSFFDIVNFVETRRL